TAADASGEPTCRAKASAPIGKVTPGGASAGRVEVNWTLLRTAVPGDRTTDWWVTGFVAPTSGPSTSIRTAGEVEGPVHLGPAKPTQHTRVPGPRALHLP